MSILGTVVGAAGSATGMNLKWYLIASIGLILMAGLQVAFFTKSFPVLFRGK